VVDSRKPVTEGDKEENKRPSTGNENMVSAEESDGLKEALYTHGTWNVAETTERGISISRVPTPIFITETAHSLPTCLELNCT
jgi:hypothetical protein